MPKEAQRCGLQNSIRVFPKIFCCPWAVGCRKFVQYIRNTYVMPRTVYLGWICTYVCIELIFDSSMFMGNKIFLEKLLQKCVVHIFTLLLALFTSKLVNYSRHSETLNLWKNSKSTTFYFENSHFIILTHSASNNWQIWTQKVPKEA